MILFYAFAKIEKNPANIIVYAGTKGLRKAENIASMPYTPSKALYKISKSKIYPALLHDCICRKTRLNLSIHRNIGVRDRTIPDIVITFTMSDKIATMLFQYFSYLFFVFSHSLLPVRAFPTKKLNYKKVLFVCSAPTTPESHTLHAQSGHQTIQTPKPSPEHSDW